MTFAGKMFVFEGSDGSGKSSLANACAQIIRNFDFEVQVLAFPGRETKSLGELVYRLHHDPASVGVSSLSHASLQTAHVAAHLDIIERVIVPALSSGMCIVLDRFWWSTYVYGIVDGVDARILETLIQLEALAWGDRHPSILFHVSRSEPLRPEPIEKWRRLNRAYDDIAQKEAHRYPVCRIKNDAAFDVIVEELRANLLR